MSDVFAPKMAMHYLLIGNGRVASHFQCYFTFLKLSFSAWDRRQPISALHEKLASATHVLLLISDQAITAFMDTHLHTCCAMRIHFSGNLISDQAHGAHPLMTFSSGLYHFDRYKQIPFVIDADAPSFETLLPGLPNPHVRLDKHAKAKYHALCVLSGNFSCMLWQKLFSSFEKEFNLKKEIAYLYLQQHTENLLTHAHQALTGPLVRADEETIANNIQALANDPFQSVYQSFVACYQQIKED